MLVQQTPTTTSFAEKEKKLSLRTSLTLSGQSVSEEDSKKKFFSNYVLHQVNFAKGSYGTISKAEDKNGQKVVIKMIPTKVPFKWIRNEIAAGGRLQHSNIVNFRESFHTSSFYYLVFDYVNGTELYTFMEDTEFAPIPEKTAKKLFKQLINAVAFSHEHGIAHRDLKLENIIVDKDLKLTVLDFGLSSINDPSDAEDIYSTEFVGSENYTAPEILRRIPYNPFLADVWSMGIILYCMLFGRFPWEDVMKVIHKRDYQGPTLRFPDVEVSYQAKLLLLQMLSFSPANRISVQQILEHPWMQ